MIWGNDNISYNFLTGIGGLNDVDDLLAPRVHFTILSSVLVFNCLMVSLVSMLDICSMPLVKVGTTHTVAITLLITLGSRLYLHNNGCPVHHVGVTRGLPLAECAAYLAKLLLPGRGTLI